MLSLPAVANLASSAKYGNAVENKESLVLDSDAGWEYHRVITEEGGGPGT